MHIPVFLVTYKIASFTPQEGGGNPFVNSEWMTVSRHDFQWKANEQSTVPVFVATPPNPMTYPKTVNLAPKMQETI